MKRRMSERSGPLSSADAARFYMTTRHNPMTIAALLRFADSLPLSAVRALVEEHLLIEKRFRQTVVEPWLPLGRPYWRAEQPFDPSAHVTFEPRSRGLSQRELADVIARRIGQPLGFALSPWRFELFNLEDGAAALLVRVHHCVSDGPSLVELLSRLSDRAIPRASAAPVVRSSQASLARVRRAALGSWHMLRLSSEPHTALRARPSGEKRVAWSAALDLAIVSRAAIAHNVRVTELLLSLIATSVARCLARASEPVPARLRAIVPFAIGGADGGLGNHYASLFVELPLGALDSAERLTQIASAFRKQRGRAETRVALGLAHVAGALVRPLIPPIVNWFSDKASLVVSNVAGPPQRLSLMGHEVRSIVVFAPTTGHMTVACTLFGYAGELRLGVETDAAIQIRPDSLVSAFEAALDEFCGNA